MPDSADIRMARALVSLDGLSVGDAFGERFFLHPHMAQLIIGERGLPDPPWRYTDDTQMALSIVETLRTHGEINQTFLATRFGERYDPSRGYGPAMHHILRRINDGEDWQIVAASAFSGQGSFGNGGAMRVAPLGAYFADDLEIVRAQAFLAAEITHAHPEGIAGAVAVALAAAWACHLRESHSTVPVPDFLDALLPAIPDSAVRMKISRARDFRADLAVEHAAAMLGNGVKVSAQDTVPFCLWSAAKYLDNFEEAMWATVRALGDRDTTCAIVGGIVACYTGVEGIPADWLVAREPLPDGVLA
jgi:ADP-ribosylglycohydrolase